MNLEKPGSLGSTGNSPKRVRPTFHVPFKQKPRTESEDVNSKANAVLSSLDPDVNVNRSADSVVNRTEKDQVCHSVDCLLEFF